MAAKGPPLAGKTGTEEGEVEMKKGRPECHCEK